MSTDLPSFNKNYETLKNIADQLRSESDKDIPDIDNLLPMVKEATLAYEACKERLSAVQEALNAFEESTSASQKGVETNSRENTSSKQN